VETIPLFPLGTVLFPGMVLPLRIFEPRYRELMAELLARPDGTPREFGVVAIRQGWEVGADGVSALYPIGCTATVRRAEQLDDGTYEIVTVGADRFELGEVDTGSRPYLQAQVRRLPSAIGAADDPAQPAAGEVAVLARSVLALYRDYLGALAATALVELPSKGQLAGLLEEITDDPLLLSSVVAATSPLELADQQSLLAEPDAISRLRAELRLLKREATMFARLRAVPVPLTQLGVATSLN
jgi:Lon protease-like protein